MVLVRRAKVGDAAGMARVHVASWESTYADLLPAAYIAERTLAVREAFWTDRLAESDPSVCIFVACGEDGRICGFASGGPETTGRMGMAGELYSIYLLEEAQGQRLGRKLVGAVLAALPDGPVLVWALGENPACRFYERLGARFLLDRHREFGGVIRREVAYALRPSE